MACHLISTILLTNPVLICYQSDPKEEISVKFKSKYDDFDLKKKKKMQLHLLCAKWWPFCPALNV